MFKKVIIALLVFCLACFPVYAEQPEKVEAFNIEKGKVTISVDKSDFYQREAEKSLQSISGVYKKISPIPKSGYLVKVPLDPAFKVQNEWLEVLTSDVILIIGKDEKPVLMLFDNENHSYFFEFDHDMTALKKELKLK